MPPPSDELERTGSGAGETRAGRACDIGATTVGGATGGAATGGTTTGGGAASGRDARAGSTRRSGVGGAGAGNGFGSGRTSGSRSGAGRTTGDGASGCSSLGRMITTPRGARMAWVDRLADARVGGTPIGAGAPPGASIGTATASAGTLSASGSSVDGPPAPFADEPSVVVARVPLPSAPAAASFDVAAGRRTAVPHDVQAPSSSASADRKRPHPVHRRLAWSTVMSRAPRAGGALPARRGSRAGRDARRPRWFGISRGGCACRSPRSGRTGRRDRHHRRAAR